MKAIAEYEGNQLSHVEALYRPGERELAIELAEALGCVVSDTGFASDAGSTFLAIHPNHDDLNAQNNVFYISEMTHEQLAVEERLRRFAAQDGEFGASLAAYRDKARSRPFGVPHFALQYKSAAAVEQAAAWVTRSLAPRLEGRLHVRVYRPEDSDATGNPHIQCFVHQDVIVSGSFLLGQLIELQTPLER